MLVLARKPGERIRIGDDIVIEVVEQRGDKLKLGITAPQCVGVWREELYLEMQRDKDDRQEANGA